MAPDPENRQIREDIEAKLQELMIVIKGHSGSAAEGGRNQAIYFVWDFVKRSQYMLSEYENIKNGNPLQHPDQFSSAPGTGPRAAKKVFDDVCSRSMMIKMLIDDNTGKMTGVDVGFSAKCKEKAAELFAICMS